MKRLVVCGVLTLGLLACGQDKQGTKEPPKINPGPSGNGTGEKPTKPVTPPPPSVVLAQLAGYPQDKSGEAVYMISVSSVKEYKYKHGSAEGVDCSNPGGFSAYQPISNQIKIDLSDNEKPLIVKLCVYGRNDAGEEQKSPTEVSWVWSPIAPTLGSDMELQDGNNQVKILPKTVTGMWMIVRSPTALSALPTPGKTYAVNDPIGNGTVVAMGPVAEFTDTTVKNTESWSYTFFAYNGAKRYSAPVAKPIILREQVLRYFAKDDIKPTFVGVAPRGAADARYVCRANHIVAGVNKGVQPGRTMMIMNNDFKASRCLFEYGGQIFAATDFEVLMVNKGDPMDKLRWVSTSGSGYDPNNPNLVIRTFIPAGAMEAGKDEDGTVLVSKLYVCRGLDANGTIFSVGKTGPQLGGCLMPSVANTPQPSVRTTLEVLVLR